MDPAEGEALPHLGGREGDESDRLIHLYTYWQNVAEVLDSDSGIEDLRFEHYFLGMPDAPTSSLHVQAIAAQ
ncbi:hypothetical protein [Brevibacterium aurantiacum]|uniref:Uncharacterized protein n=1 Tax=Brevibacterium aurantiacum TaxID=273384 RepID=A0A2A3ZKD2_BREAU|nr:hypothetical protein [Brevibacterium aurantiacum]PCC52006.1 hypothetical protein CIK62_00815 [Brevibacterium aurantiacum]